MGLNYFHVMLSSIQNTLIEWECKARNGMSHTWIIHKTLTISHYEWKKLVTFTEKVKLFHILQQTKHRRGQDNSSPK